MDAYPRRSKSRKNRSTCFSCMSLGKRSRGLGTLADAKEKFGCVEKSKGLFVAKVCGKVSVELTIPSQWPQGLEYPMITSMATPSGVPMSKGVVQTLNDGVQSKQIRDVYAILLVAEEQMQAAFA